MSGIVKKMLPITRSMSSKECGDFDNDISFAMEYTGSPVNHSTIPMALPVELDRIPTAKVAPSSPSLLSNLSLPMVQPIVKSCFRVSLEGKMVKDLNFDYAHEGKLVKDSKFDDTVDGKLVFSGKDTKFDDTHEAKLVNDCKFDDAHESKLAKDCKFVNAHEGKLVKDCKLDGAHEGKLVKDSNFDDTHDEKLVSRGKGVKFEDIELEKFRISEGNVNDKVNGGVYVGGDFERNGGLKGIVGKRDDGVESSGTLGFSDSQDHSHELSESSDLLDTPGDIRENEGYESYMDPVDWCEEGEVSDGEALECRRNKAGVTFCDPSSEMEGGGGEESVDYDEGFLRGRPVAEKPAKKGSCYNCHKGNRFTEKEICIVCDAKYCKRCILRIMGSMPEGRKCVRCIGFPVAELKRIMLGKCSRMLKGLLNESEVKQIMEAEISHPVNQLPAERVFVNGCPLSVDELMELRYCSNPPTNLSPGNYWYDKVSGFWGKEGHKPCQIITPQLNVGDEIKREASNGNTNVLINGREITKAELWMLKSAGVQCAGNPCFWVHSDGTYQEEGMNLVKGKIWGRKRTKVLCTLLSLPTSESPNPGGQSNRADDGALVGYFNERASCNFLLVGNDHSGTTTVYKQTRLLYGNPFSEDERENIKFMIQSNLYGYIGRLLEGREQFEEESLSVMKKIQSPDEPGPSSTTPTEIECKSEYAIGKKLKAFSDWLINIMVSGNLDIIFLAATREYAPYVEELWKDAAFQATYRRRNELELPKVATYFLDKAVDVAKVDYEPSDDDILYAEGVTSFNGLASMEFSFSLTTNDCYADPAEQPDPITRYQLVRVQSKSLGVNCKWVEMFEDVRVILFCVSLTEYDEYEVNSHGVLTNKMLESKKLFESIVTHPTFNETNVLLLLNKFDLLEQMIEQVSLKNCEWFHDFNPVYSTQSSRKNNGNTLAQRAFHYMAVKFKKLYKNLTGKKLYVCPVTAVKSDNVDGALRYAREIVRWEEERWNYSLNDSSCESIEMEASTYSGS